MIARTSSTAPASNARPPKRSVDQNDGCVVAEALSSGPSSLRGTVVPDASAVVGVVAADVSGTVVAPPPWAACCLGTFVYCWALGASRVGVGSKGTQPWPVRNTSGQA